MSITTLLVDLDLIVSVPLLRREDPSKRERESKCQDDQATMAFRDKNPNVLAKAFDESKQRAAQSNVQKQRGYTLNPSILSVSNKENEHALVPKVKAKHDPVIQRTSSLLKKSVVVPLVEMESMAPVQANPNSNKTWNGLDSKKAPLDFAGAVRSNLSTSSNKSSFTRLYSLNPTSVNQAPTLAGYAQTLTSWSKSTDPNAGTFRLFVF